MMKDEFKVINFFKRLPFKIQYFQQMIQINAELKQIKYFHFWIKI
jgi:hypothetical protein